MLKMPRTILTSVPTRRTVLSSSRSGKNVSFPTDRIPFAISMVAVQSANTKTNSATHVIMASTLSDRFDQKAVVEKMALQTRR